LRVVSLLVPGNVRRRWLDEWTAELWILENRPAETGRAPSPLGLGLAALRPALWHRKKWAVAIMMQDVRLALRTLRRNPVFTALAIILVALGVGANTTIFSMANGALLRAPDGIDSPERLVQIGRDRAEQGFDNMAYPWFNDFRERVEGLEGLAAYTSRSLVTGRGADVAVLNGQLVTGDYFSVLGIHPAVGRLLQSSDDRPAGASPVVVISHGLWMRRFGGDNSIVGREIRINASEFEVIGVAESGFQGIDVVSPPIDMWIPVTMAGQALGPDYADYDRRGFSWLWMVGRLAPGSTPQELRAELNAFYEPAYEDAWGEPPGHDVGVVPGVGLRPDEREAVARIMTMLMAVAALVLLVACTNLANLLLARGVSRTHELGIRTALGAPRGRLVRELLTESVVLALGGGMLALAITYWTAGMVLQLFPVSLSVSFHPDAWVFAFALTVSILAGVVFGVVPALRAAKAGSVRGLQEGAPVTGRSAGWLRGGLVAGQLALSFPLLAVTGLLVQSLLHANAADPGYNTRDVITMTLNLDLAGYDRARGEQVYDELVSRAEALPGVEAAALGSSLPFAGWRRRSVYFPEERPSAERQFFEVDMTAVSSGFFETLQIPLINGELFNDANSGARMPGVVIVSESAAQFFWPEQDAVGRLLPLTERRVPEESLRVIGIVGDVQVRSLRQRPRPSIYLPAAQDYSAWMSLFVRTAGEPTSLTRPLQALVRDLAPDLGIMQMGVLHDRMGSSLRDTLAVARLGGVFGILAVVLAAIGLYGVVSHVASSRTREIGVRMALGARSADVLALFLRQGGKLAAAGMVLGFLLTLAASGAIASFLYGVSATDPSTLLIIATAVLLIAMLATVLPALRASRVDPVASLRRE
jgi:predicted permease